MSFLNCCLSMNISLHSFSNIILCIICPDAIVLCKSNESEMREFHSLPLLLFKENSSVFLQCLEHYFFQTKDKNFPHFRDQNEKSLPEESFRLQNVKCSAVM